MLFDPFHVTRDEHRSNQGCGLVLNILEDAFGVRVVGGNGDGSDHGSLPEVLIVDLGYGNVELVPQPIFQSS